jgi:hypothetical protein
VEHEWLHLHAGRPERAAHYYVDVLFKSLLFTFRYRGKCPFSSDRP